MRHLLHNVLVKRSVHSMRQVKPVCRRNVLKRFVNWFYTHFFDGLTSQQQLSTQHSESHTEFGIHPV